MDPGMLGRFLLHYECFLLAVLESRSDGKKSVHDECRVSTFAVAQLSWLKFYISSGVPGHRHSLHLVNRPETKEVGMDALLLGYLELASAGWGI